MATEHPLHPENPVSKYPESECPAESECLASECPAASKYPESECPESECPAQSESPAESECPASEYSESDTTIGEDREEEVIQEAIIVAVLARKKRENQLYHTGLRGRDYVRELLNCGNQRRCFEVLRMSLTTFQALVHWLVINTELKGSRIQAGLQIEEKVMIFLYIISRGALNRDAAERFSHSNQTISK